MADFTVQDNNEFTEALLIEHEMAEQKIYELSVEYPLDFAANYLSDYFSPDEVFSDKDLSDWAKSNGYTKE